MNTIDIINNFKEERNSKLTTAQICYELKKAASGLTEDKIKSYQSKPLSENNKEEALDTISSFLAEREADNQISAVKAIESTKEKNTEKASDSKAKNSHLSDDNKNRNKENIDNENKVLLPPPTDDEIKQFVIPVIADKIITNGKDGNEPNTVTYHSDNFSAMLRLGDEEQTISLDRKDSENINALVASKGNNQQEYQIIINNLKHEEFEKFKALFDKATQKETSEKENKKNSELD